MNLAAVRGLFLISLLHLALGSAVSRSRRAQASAGASPGAFLQFFTEPALLQPIPRAAPSQASTAKALNMASSENVDQALNMSEKSSATGPASTLAASKATAASAVALAAASDVKLTRRANSTANASAPQEAKLPGYLPMARFVEAAAPSPPVPEIASAPQGFAALFDSMRFTVVRIQAIVAKVDWLQPYKSTSDTPFIGSGFLVDKLGHDPVFLTNAHVVQDAHTVQVQLPALGQMIFDAYVPLICKRFDLAVVQLKNPESFWQALKQHNGTTRALSIRSNTVSLGLEVAAVGFPLGSSSLKLSRGIISGTEMVDGTICYQSTAPISPGSSGGPLFAVGTGDGTPTGKVEDLQIIGVNFASSASEGAQNVNYVVPTIHLLQVLHEFRKLKTGSDTQGLLQAIPRYVDPLARVDPNGLLALPARDGGRLWTWYSHHRKDHVVSNNSAFDKVLQDTGYVRLNIGATGYVEQTNVSGTVPLRTWWSSDRNDHAVSDNSALDKVLKDAGYVRLTTHGTIGYVYRTQVSGTVPLRTWYSSARGDHAVSDNSAFDTVLKDSGYMLLTTGTIGYVRQASLALGFAGALAAPALEKEVQPHPKRSRQATPSLRGKKQPSQDAPEEAPPTKYPHFQLRIAPIDAIGIEASEALYNTSGGCHQGVFLSRILPTSALRFAKPPVEERSFLTAVDSVMLDSFGMGRTANFLGDPTPFESLMTLRERVDDPVVLSVCQRGKQTKHVVSIRWRPEYSFEVPDVEEPHFEEQSTDFDIFAGVTMMQMTMNHIVELLKNGKPQTLSRWLLIENQEKPRIIITHVEEGTYASRVLTPGMVLQRVNGKNVSTLVDLRKAFEPKGVAWTLETDRGLIFSVIFKEALKTQVANAVSSPGRHYLLSKAPLEAATKLKLLAVPASPDFAAIPAPAAKVEKASQAQARAASVAAGTREGQLDRAPAGFLAVSAPAGSKLI